MKFLADECCDVVIVEGLRQDGHDVFFVAESMRGAKDQVVLQTGADQSRIVLTDDKDFGELTVRLRLPAYGVVLLRIDSADADQKLQRLREVLSKHQNRFAEHFVVIDERKVRFRRLRPLR